MIFILANDSNLARRWAEDQSLPDTDWRSATVEELRAFPSGDHGEHSLVILEGAERSPEYSTIFALARDRGIDVSSVPMSGSGHAA